MIAIGITIDEQRTQTPWSTYKHINMHTHARASQVCARTHTMRPSPEWRPIGQATGPRTLSLAGHDVPACKQRCHALGVVIGTQVSTKQDAPERIHEGHESVPIPGMLPAWRLAKTRWPADDNRRDVYGASCTEVLLLARPIRGIGKFIKFSKCVS